MKPEKKLKLSIEALDNFGVYPEIIKDMLNDLTKLVAEKFHWEYEKKNSPNWLEGVPDLVDYLTKYGSKLENQYIPNDAHSFEVFAIKDSEDSPTGKQAFIGFKLDNGNFHFIGVPYTEKKKKKQNLFSKFFKSFIDKLKLKR